MSGERKPSNPGDPGFLREDRIEEIAESFLRALRGGRRPDRTDLILAHPDLGKDLEDRLALVELLFLAGSSRKENGAGAP